MNELGGSAESGSGGARAAIAGERKQVTVLFADVAGSMELTAALGEERWGALLDRFLSLACGAIEELEGSANQFHGDGLMAVFGAPLGHEDHARRACLAALEIQRRISPLAAELAREDGAELALRCGLDSGEVVVGAIGEGMRLDFAPIGNTGGRAKRIESLARPGSIALGAATAALVGGELELRELGEFELKGVSEPECVYELRGARPPAALAESATQGRRSPFVGREAERAALEAAMERALAGEGAAVGIRGEAGVGKSRLVRELAADWRRRGVRVDAARALSHERAAPLLPVIELLRAAFGVEDGDREVSRRRVETALRELDAGLADELPLLLELLGLADREEDAEQIDPEARRRRLLVLVRRLVEARARREPAAIVLEDVHWLDPASHAFLDEFVRGVAGTRALLVLSFRPGFETEWGDGDAYEELPLAPLSGEASAKLLAAQLGDDPSLGELSERILERTGGNPFFIEELVRALAAAGQLAGERGAHRLSTPSEPLLPATVQAVLDARIDRLAAREKELLRTMAVIGREVDRAVLGEVTELEGEELRDALAALAGAEFIVGAPAGERLAFKHPLVQEVAYASQLSDARARIHAAAATAIEGLDPERLDERAALVAHHREAAGESLSAAQWHARAANWAAATAPSSGIDHWRRAAELSAAAESGTGDSLAALAAAGMLGLAGRIGMPPGEAAAMHAESRRRLSAPSHERVLLDLAYAGFLGLANEMEAAFALGNAAAAEAERLGDPGLVLNARCYAAVGALIMGSPVECVEQADSALAWAGDDAALGTGLVTRNPYAHCLWARGHGLMMLGSFAGAERAFDCSLEVAAEFADPLSELFVLSSRGLFGVHRLEPRAGLADAERAVQLAGRAGDNQARVGAQTILAYVQAECGSHREAQAMVERSLEIIDAHGAGLVWKPEVLYTLAAVRFGLGDPGGARAAVSEAIEIAERHSLKRSALGAYLVLARTLARGEGAELGAAEVALAKAEVVAAETGYRGAQPLMLRERAEQARLRGNDETAERREAELDRVLAELNGSAAA